jgi:rubrerythrin
MELRRVAMTENEAIKELETSIDLAKMCTQNYERKNEIQGYEMAIKSLEEVQQYRQIGTVEECREAVEKQTAKKPDYEGDGYSDGQLVYDTWICPCCGQHYEVDCDRYDYCPNCGQRIDWRDEDGKTD